MRWPGKDIRGSGFGISASGISQTMMYEMDSKMPRPRMKHVLTLQDSLYDAVEERGMRFIWLHRIGSHAASVAVCCSDGRYQIFGAQADDGIKTREEIDDVIYDRIVESLDAKRQ